MPVVADLRPRVDLLARLSVAAPKQRLSKTRTLSPAAANTSAKLSRYISLTAEKPCAMTTAAAGPLAPTAG